MARAIAPRRLAAKVVETSTDAEALQLADVVFPVPGRSMRLLESSIALVAIAAAILVGLVR